MKKYVLVTSTECDPGEQKLFSADYDELELLISGDEYHDHIQARLEGYFEALRDLDMEYNIVELVKEDFSTEDNFYLDSLSTKEVEDKYYSLSEDEKIERSIGV